MLDTKTDILSRLLDRTAAELDIPTELRAAATAEYERVGHWLAAYADGPNGWIVHPQGSFLLNTVVLPADGDEYDVDTVCRREIPKQSTTQARLKLQVGDALTEYRLAHLHLPDGPVRRRERKRCWTLCYAPHLRFHLDVLPAIPNPETSATGILITDRDLREWQRSDPLAYAEWFKHRAAEEFTAKRLLLAEASHTPPQEIPEWEVKTTLHRVVQVLKLHRNEFFRHDLDARPASVLVTTLAAHAYRGERPLFEAVLDAAQTMTAYVLETPDGLLVPNPVEPRENFADRWRDRPDLAERCFEWLDVLVDDLRDAASQQGVDRVGTRLSESFGRSPVERAVARLGDDYRRTRRAGALSFAPASGMLSTAEGTRVRDHDFFGDAV